MLLQIALPILCPLVAACVYAVAAICLKRGTEQGVGPWRVAFITNLIQAALFTPLWLLPSLPFSTANLFHAVMSGSAFFAGQIFTFLALSRGDVSVATPILGTKVILVAFLTVTLLGESIPSRWWFAAALAVCATALIGVGKPVRKGGESFFRSLLYGFSAATAFALTDVLTQKWAPTWGFAHFAPTMFLTVGVLSLCLLPAFDGTLSCIDAGAWKWIIAGAVLLSMQAAAIATAIMQFGEATLVNILYSSRGVWTVVFVWMIGHWFGNEERSHGHGIMARRLAGSALLLAAIFLSTARN